MPIRRQLASSIIHECDSCPYAGNSVNEHVFTLPVGNYTLGFESVDELTSWGDFLDLITLGIARLSDHAASTNYWSLLDVPGGKMLGGGPRHGGLMKCLAVDTSDIGDGGVGFIGSMMMMPVAVSGPVANWAAAAAILRGLSNYQRRRQLRQPPLIGAASVHHRKQMLGLGTEVAMTVAVMSLMIPFWSFYVGCFGLVTWIWAYVLEALIMTQFGLPPSRENVENGVHWAVSTQFLDTYRVVSLEELPDNFTTACLWKIPLACCFVWSICGLYFGYIAEDVAQSAFLRAELCVKVGRLWRTLNQPKAEEVFRKAEADLLKMVGPNDDGLRRIRDAIAAAREGLEPLDTESRCDGDAVAVVAAVDGPSWDVAPTIQSLRRFYLYHQPPGKVRPGSADVFICRGCVSAAVAVLAWLLWVSPIVVARTGSAESATGFLYGSMDTKRTSVTEQKDEANDNVIVDMSGPGGRDVFA